MSVLYVPTQIIKIVTAAGTPEAIAADGTYFRQATIIGKKSARTNNTSAVYLGVSSTNDTQAITIQPGESQTISMPREGMGDLNDWYIDVETAGDGVIVIY